MGDSERWSTTWPGLGASPEATARYRIDVLPLPDVEAGGVSFAEGATRSLLGWPSILHALAAEVGEPEGVRTIVFDLVIERKAHECAVFRFDLEPGPEAQAVANRIAEQLGRERCSRSLLELAADGVPSRAFQDLATLAESALEELGLF